MSTPTPRTDSLFEAQDVAHDKNNQDRWEEMRDFARTLERELAAEREESKARERATIDEMLLRTQTS